MTAGIIRLRRSLNSLKHLDRSITNVNTSETAPRAIEHPTIRAFTNSYGQSRPAEISLAYRGLVISDRKNRPMDNNLCLKLFQMFASSFLL